MTMLQSQVTQFIALALLGVMVSVSFLPLANTFSFKLSQLIYADDADTDMGQLQRPVFPRRDLEQEFGKIKYQCLIETALALDGGVCRIGDLDDGFKIYEHDVTAPAGNVVNYGVDVSFPIHTMEHLEDERRDFYREFVDGCKAYYSSAPHTCDQFESDRMDMNRNQPPVMQNYTFVGFQKTKAPSHVMSLLVDFFQSNDNEQVEKWNPGDTHTNHWKAKTLMMNVQDSKFRGGGIALASSVWNEVHDVLMRWLKTDNPDFRYRLSPTSLYGIRTYTQGAVLAPHVDRLPLVISAIINVAQDLDGGEAWPLEVYAHDGVAYNVTLEPGDMLLYESHSVIHGRPYPFQGKYYSNVFVHFEPEGHCVRHSDRMHGYDVQDDVEELFQRAKRSQEVISSSRHHQSGSRGPDKSGEHSAAAAADGVFSASELPFFIQPNSLEAKRWKQQVTYDRNINELRRAPPPNAANLLASRGELAKLKELVEQDPEILFKADVNGWQPIHEAARAGNTEVIKFLIEKGVDVNARTNGGRGASPLWWAEDQHGVDHEASNLLRKAGAVSLAPKI